LWATDTSSLIVAPDGQIVRDWSPDYEGCGSEEWFWALEAAEQERFPGLLAPVTVRWGWVNSYYHWMFEALPRFHLLLASDYDIDRFATHVLAQDFQQESLELMGIALERRLELDTPRRVKANHLLVTPILPAVIPPWVCKMLRDLVLTAIPKTGKNRIYISRSEAGRGRHVTNEVEIVTTLERNGFRSVVLEAMSVREQAVTFAEAECVVAPHGSGLTNLVFCDPGTKVIELFAPTYVHPLYWFLSNRMALDYYFLVGEGSTPLEWNDWPKTGGLDSMTIDATHLTAILKRVGASTCRSGH
jgi:capsular polysaccharide biosynthesis protein